MSEQTPAVDAVVLSVEGEALRTVVIKRHASTDPSLVFFVREAWPSKSTDDVPLVLAGEMNAR